MEFPPYFSLEQFGLISPEVSKKKGATTNNLSYVDTNATTLVLNSSTKSVVYFMDNHTRDSGVQYMGCAVLRNLLTGSCDDDHTAVGRAGGSPVRHRIYSSPSIVDQCVQ